MKTKNVILSLIILSAVTISTGFGEKRPSSKLKEEKVTYSVGNKVFNSVLVYDESVTGKRPAILVVPEWWGMTDYPVMRARKLAELGYIAMAVDMYGDGKIAANPTEAQELAMPFYKDPQLSKTRMEAALSKLRKFKNVDLPNVFAIGYCFGGSVVLNYAKMGADLKGVVSFHGGLAGVPAQKKLLKAKILVCSGGNDQFLPEKDITTFRNQLDSIGADYKFIVYPNATHAFTNPDATKIGKQFNMPIAYNEKADLDSWNDMKMFLSESLKK